MKKILITILFFVVGFIIILFGYNKFFSKNKNSKNKSGTKTDVKIEYSTYVVSLKKINLYDKNKKKIGTISKGARIILDDEYKIKDKYAKIKDTNYYIKYNNVNKSEEFTYDKEYKTYKNYILYNENIKTKEEYKLYSSDVVMYTINNSDTYPIIIKDDNRYGVEFNGELYYKDTVIYTINSSDTYAIIIKEDNKYGVEYNSQLYYINSDDVESTVDANNSEDLTASSLAVLNYHYTIDKNSDEGTECKQSICMSDTQVDEEIKYLKDNNFYPVTMEDLYLFLTGKIQLPEKSVAITIDDGWYLTRMIAILEKYQMQGTLYLIGSLASPNDYQSTYLEIHSHTWDMHTPGVCNGSHGGGLLCESEEKILDDLKKSRESLNNTEILCYPFYEYNARTIELVKQAGFKMALAGGYRKAKVGDNIYAVPRFELGNYTTIDEFIKIVN